MMLRIEKYVLLQFSLFLFVSSASFSQNDLYIPKDIQMTYRAGTRSFDGRPGENYWQNRADYKIEVELIPETRKVIGSEEIDYFNNSPDTLTELYFHIYQDFFKKGNFRDFPVSPLDVHDGVKIHSVAVNGAALETEKGFEPNRSLLYIELPQPLLPNNSVKIGIKWDFVLPHISNIRYGTYDPTTFFVAYWFPSVVVYDDIEGWNTTSFTGTQEFFNNFGDFDVEITVPQNHIVWATGTLQNPEELLNKKYLELYQNAQQSDEIINIITADDLNRNIVKGRDKTTWHFKAENVVDFAFATSDHFLWDATSLIVDSESKRRVFVQAAYNKDSKDFYEVADIAKKSVAFFSEKMPGIPFPYPEITVFNGGGGMEFPMMVNDGSSSSLSGTVHLTSHEILHSYFPFYMGTNEQKYAWMDEGWAVMLPLDFQEREAPGYKPLENLAKSYSYYSGNEEEVPLMILSSSLSGKSYYGTYRIAAYTRPALAYEFLKDMLGEKKFKEAMKEYIDRWNGKHPMPYDFFFTFNDFLGEDLNWYWKPWFFESGYPELMIENAEYSDGVSTCKVVRKGNLPVPVLLKYSFENGQPVFEYLDASIWKDGKTFIMYKKSFTRKPVKVELDTSEIPDINKSNNSAAF